PMEQPRSRLLCWRNCDHAPAFSRSAGEPGVAATGLENARMLTRLNHAWIDLSLRGKGLIVVAIPLVALVIGAVSSTLVAGQQRSANAWVQHSLLVRNVAGRALRDQTDAAASVRSYLLTGDSADLAPARQIERDV